MNNSFFDDEADRYIITADLDSKTRQETKLWDRQTWDRFKVETAGTTTRVVRAVVKDNLVYAVCTLRSHSRDAARLKHFAVVGLIQREGFKKLVKNKEDLL